MFFITCFSKCENNEQGDLDFGDIRTFGYFDTLETCKQALNENWCDMHEYWYKFAVIEKIGQGIHPRAKEVAWFRWDDEMLGFYEMEKPEWSNGWCNFALG